MLYLTVCLAWGCCKAVCRSAQRAAIRACVLPCVLNSSGNDSRAASAYARHTFASYKNFISVTKIKKFRNPLFYFFKIVSSDVTFTVDHKTNGTTSHVVSGIEQKNNTSPFFPWMSLRRLKD
jgi:hypothetical protein